MREDAKVLQSNAMFLKGFASEHKVSWGNTIHFYKKMQKLCKWLPSFFWEHKSLVRKCFTSEFKVGKCNSESEQKLFKDKKWMQSLGEHNFLWENAFCRWTQNFLRVHKPWMEIQKCCKWTRSWTKSFRGNTQVLCENAKVLRANTKFLGRTQLFLWERAEVLQENTTFFKSTQKFCRGIQLFCERKQSFYKRKLKFHIFLWEQNTFLQKNAKVLQVNAKILGEHKKVLWANTKFLDCFLTIRTTAFARQQKFCKLAQNFTGERHVLTENTKIKSFIFKSNPAKYLQENLNSFVRDSFLRSANAFKYGQIFLPFWLSVISKCCELDSFSPFFMLTLFV